MDEHDTQGWEQIEHPKRRKSDKQSDLQTNKTKLAKPQITEKAKEGSFKALLEDIEIDQLMETGNTDADDGSDDNDDDVDDDDDVGMDEDEIDDDDETEDNQIEEFPDDLPRATHSYKNDFPDKNANEYEVTKWIRIRISFKKPNTSNSKEANQVHPYMVKLASMINNTTKLNNKPV